MAIFLFRIAMINELKYKAETMKWSDHFNDEVLHEAIHWLSIKVIQVLFGFLILFISFKVINLFTSKLNQILNRKKIDQTIAHALFNITRKGLKIGMFFLFLGYIGIETSSIIALFASFGVGIGLAFQGALSNLAGGLIILIMRPFKLGDHISCGDEEGIVEEIKIFYTYVITFDQRVVMIPNGNVANGKIINHNMKEVRRVDMVFFLSYEENIEKVRNIILECIHHFPSVLGQPKPMIHLHELHENDLSIMVKVWCKNEDYWDIYWFLPEEIKQSFQEHHISIPHKKLEVKIKKD